MAGHVAMASLGGAALHDARSLTRFVALSLLLHLLLLVAIRESDWVGGGVAGSAFIAGLDVALRPFAADRRPAGEGTTVDSSRGAAPARESTAPGAAAALPPSRADARPAERNEANAGELPTVESPRPENAVDAPAHFVAPPEGLAAPAIPLGRLEAAPKVDREFAPLSTLAPPRALPPANAPPLPHLEPAPIPDRSVAPTVRLAPPMSLPPVDAPLPRIEPAPAIERGLTPLPTAERPRALATEAPPLRRLDDALSVERSLTPLPTVETPRALTDAVALQPLAPAPSSERTLAPLPDVARPSGLSAPVPARLETPALDRALATPPAAAIPRELANETPLPHLDAPPTADRMPAPLPKVATPGELSAATPAPLQRLAAPQGVDRAIAAPAPLAPPPDLPAAGATPLARIVGAPAIDRGIAQQPAIEFRPVGNRAGGESAGGDYRGAGSSGRLGDSSGASPPGGTAGAAPAIDRPYAPGQELMPRDAARSDGAPRLDLDATRRLARAINRAPVTASRGRALIFTSPPPETESRLGRAIAKAAQPDCRDAFAGLGLLALPILIAEAITDTGCRW